MVAVTGSTQYALQLDVTRNIRHLNLQLTKQNQQLGSGRYADGLIGVSQRALELSQLKAQLGTVTNYKSAVQTAQNRVDMYAFTIEEIIDIATEAQETMIKNRDPFFARTAAPREQAMVIIARAMGITGLKGKLPAQSADVVLQAFGDADQASGWAIAGIADAVQAGIVHGRSTGSLAPQEMISRAEAAAMIERLLQESGLI